MTKDSFSYQTFKTCMAGPVWGGFQAQNKIAIGVSGGPDSMALLHLLSQWAQEKDDRIIYALSVDHGLRPESLSEAEQVNEIVREWPSVSHHILRWERNGQVTAKVQERARAARYDLMTRFCAERDVSYLCTAHHQNDQAETFLFRLSKGSGLDGLACMAPFQPLSTIECGRAENRTVTLVRPLLDIPKQDLVDYCKGHKIPTVSDPSNSNLKYARSRLRAIQDDLEKEGLSAKRLSQTARRMGRARQALEIISETVYGASRLKKSGRADNDRFIDLDLENLKDWPDEIVLRVIILAMNELVKGGNYGPRFEKIERLAADLLSHTGDFPKQTLGGLIFQVHDGGRILRLCPENKEK